MKVINNLKLGLIPRPSVIVGDHSSSRTFVMPFAHVGYFERKATFSKIFLFHFQNIVKLRVTFMYLQILVFWEYFRFDYTIKVLSWQC